MFDKNVAYNWECNIEEGNIKELWVYINDENLWGCQNTMIQGQT